MTMSELRELILPDGSRIPYIEEKNYAAVMS